MVVNVRRYAVPFVVNVDYAAVRHARWRKNMPFNKPLYHPLKKIRNRIYHFILKDARWISIFVLQAKRGYFNLCCLPIVSVLILELSQKYLPLEGIITKSRQYVERY